MKKLMFGLGLTVLLCGCNDTSKADTPKEYCGRLADRSETLTSMRNHEVPFEDVIELLRISDRPTPDQKRLMNATRYIYSNKDDTKVIKANVLMSCYDELITQKEAKRKQEEVSAASYTPTPVMIPNGSGGTTVMMF